MSVEIYLENLTQKLQNYFTIHPNYILENERLDIYAYCSIDNQKYLASKKMKIWAYEVNEKCFIKVFKDKVNNNTVLEFTKWLEGLIDEQVTPHSEHMQTYLTGVMITTESIAPDLISCIEKYKYSKSFKFGFLGWCDLRLVVVDLTNRQVFTNKKAEEVKSVYQP